jgi:hypothetical protein
LGIPYKDFNVILESLSNYRQTLLNASNNSGGVKFLHYPAGILNNDKKPIENSISTFLVVAKINKDE